MTTKTVTTKLMLEVSDYVRNSQRAAQATRTLVDDVRRGTGAVAKELRGVQTQSTLVGAALLALPAAAVAVNLAFDKQMSGVQAVTGATADEMERLREAAIRAGQATAFSATDAATAEAELAKAGIQTADIVGGALSGSLSLAAAGQLDLADAATISAQAMNTFGLAGRDVNHIADVLSAGANKSAADVGQLGDALRQGGLVAEQTGLSLEDTVGVLSAFADRALVGSDAGTSLKTMLQRLTPQSQQAADAMDKLGIHAYDAKGNFVGLAAFAQNLKTSMQRLTPEARNAAMAVIFGSDAVRGANVLYDLGAQGVNSYTKAVNDNGAASRMAATQMDNLAGDLEQLKGSVETALIQSGSDANGVLRDMVQAGTGVVNFIGSLPGPLLVTGAAAATMAGGFLIAAPRIVAVNEALAANPKLAAAARGGLMALGPAFAVAAVAGFAMDMAHAQDETDKLHQELEALYATLGKKVSATAIDELRSKISDLEQATTSPGGLAYLRNTLEELWNARPSNPLFFRTMDDTAKATEELNSKAADLDQARTHYSRFLEAVNQAAWALGVTNTRAMEIATSAGIAYTGSVNEMAASIQVAAATQSTGSSATHKASAAMDVLADSTATVEDRLKALKDQWDATTGSLLGASNATIAAEKALDDMSATIKDNGNTWDITTEKGRANQSQLNDSIQTFEDLRTKLIETGQATEQQANAKMVTYLTQLRNELPKNAKTARAELDALIAKYREIPASKTTTVKADTSQAVAAVNALGHLIDARFGGVRFAITATGEVNAHGTRHAAGGYITGAGSGTSDSIAARLSNGEYVVNAAATARNRALLDAVNYGPGPSLVGRAPTPGAGGGGSQDFTLTAPVQIVQDSVVAWQGLLRLKRSRGGIDLGLG